VLILLAIFIIAMAVGAPRIAYSIQRDRELETMERGKQYIRAIQLYHRKFQAYPPSIDALVKTNEIRFLRKRYIDPVTGKDDWKPIMYCQNKAPIAMGFFGQPLGPTSGCGPVGGIGPSGGNGLQGGLQGSTNSSSLTTGSIFNNNSTNPTSPTSPAGPASPTAPSPTDGQTGTTGATGQSPTDANGNPTSGTSGGIFGDNGQTFGGGGIIGVSPASPKKSILIYKKKDHYNQWEFTYSPLMDMQTITGGNAGTIGQPVGGTGTGINGSNTIGPTNNNGSTPIAPQPTTPPQQ
jgi:hypothetical protein